MKRLKSKLMKRGAKGYYSLRVYIPKDLQRHHRTAAGNPKTEITVALKTADFSEARKRARPIYLDILNKIYQLPDPKEYTWRPVVWKGLRYEFADDARWEDGPKAVEQVEFLQDEHPNVTDAAEEIEERLGEEVAKEWMDKARGTVTLKNAPEVFREFCNQRGKGTLKTRAKRFQHHTDLANWFRDKDAKPRDLTKLDADEYVTHLVSTGLAPATINSVVTSLSVLWRWLEARELVSRNIWRDQTLKVVPTKDTRAYLPDEIARVKEALSKESKPKHLDLFTLLLFTGCRIEEVCSLTVHQVTRDTQGHVTGFMALAGKAGEHSKDWIPVVAEDAREVLTRRTEGRDPEDMLFRDIRPGKNGWSHNVAKTLRRAVRKALGLPLEGKSDLDNHGFRRTHATAAENADPKLAPYEIDRLQRRKTGTIAGDVYSSGPDAETKVALQTRVTNRLLEKYWE